MAGNDPPLAQRLMAAKQNRGPSSNGFKSKSIRERIRATVAEDFVFWNAPRPVLIALLLKRASASRPYRKNEWPHM
jgi:hypothetical protein